MTTSPDKMTSLTDNFLQEYQCQNHIRVLLKRPDGSLYVCSTNAYNPLVRTFDVSTERSRK